MRTAIGTTAVVSAKPTNLNAPMIHAFLDNIRCITIELNGLTLCETRDDVPCDMDKWRETRARFPATLNSTHFGSGLFVCCSQDAPPRVQPR